MATLYELAKGYRELIDALADAESDEEIQHIIELISEADADIMAKGEAYTKIVRNLGSDLDAIDAEIKRLQTKKHRTEAAIDRLKESLRYSMNAAEIEKIKTPIGTWSKRLGPWSVDIIDEAAVPERFKIPQPPQISKKAILDEFKQTGEAFAGCEFRKRETVVFR